MPDSHGRPAWPYALPTLALFLGFLIAWALAGLVFVLTALLTVAGAASLAADRL